MWTRQHLGKWQNSTNTTESFSKFFLYQTLCVFSQMKDTTHIWRDFHSVAWVMPQGWSFGALGVPRCVFFKHGHVAYQIDGDDEQNRMQVNFHPRVKLVTLGWGQRVRYYSISATMSILRFLYQNLGAFLQIKDRKHIEQFCHSVAPRVGLWGAGGSKTLASGFATAPHWLRILVLFFIQYKPYLCW